MTNKQKLTIEQKMYVFNKFLCKKSRWGSGIGACVEYYKNYSDYKGGRRRKSRKKTRRGGKRRFIA